MRYQQTTERVVIVGGGIAGITIAFRLAEAGLPVTVLEAGLLGGGASTKNQGWLHSGGWFALQDPQVAKMCYESLQQTLRFCPEAVEPGTEGMAFLFSKPETLRNPYEQAWRDAGIPFEEWPLTDLHERLPGLDRWQVQHAFRLPDRSIRPDFLLQHLAAAAENAGAEIRRNASIDRLIIEQETAHGVVINGDEYLRARLVILAGDSENSRLWPKPWGEPPHTEQVTYQPFAYRTHLVAVDPGVGRIPFCVLDADGFNHLPHMPYSVFGTAGGQPIDGFDDLADTRKQIDFLWQSIRRFFPGRHWNPGQVTEWAGTKVQAIQVSPVRFDGIPRPVVIDHGRQFPRVERLLSVFPGLASLSPQLAETCRQLVLDDIGSRVKDVASPKWTGG